MSTPVSTFGPGAISPSAPVAHKGSNATIFNSGAGGDQAPLTADFKAGDVVDLGRAGIITLSVKYDADASGTANKAQIVVAVSNAAAQPAIDDDEWQIVSETESTGTDAVAADSFPAGFVPTVTPEWVVKKTRHILFDFYASDSGADKLRPPIVLTVRNWRWLVVLAKEEGDTDAGDVGTLVVEAALSA